MTQDPDGFAAGDTNLYRYVQNDPQNAYDPTGHTESPYKPPVFPPDFKPPQGWWYNNPYVRGKREQAWFDSHIDGSYDHEEGGWIYYNHSTGDFIVDPFPSGRPPVPGERYHMNPPAPKPPPGYQTVGMFHTHPDSTYAGPSDKLFSKYYQAPTSSRHG